MSLPDEWKMKALGSENRALYTTRHAPGAIPNGATIVKVTFEEGDVTPIGARGVVLGSVPPPDGVEYGYFVAWEHSPELPIFVRGRKIAPDDDRAAQ